MGIFSSPSGKSLAALALSWAMVWTLGAMVQRLNLAWGLCLTELGFIGLPAWVLLRSQASLKEPACFHRPRWGHVFWTLLIALGTIWAAVSLGLATRTILGFEPVPEDLKTGPIILVSIGMLMLAPLCEELLFRAVLLRSFLQEMSSRNAVLVSALLFAMYHGSVQRLPETLILGLFLGMVFVRSGRYWLAVLLHFVANLLGPGLFLVGRTHPGWFHPVAVLPLALAALYGVYRLGEPSPGEVRDQRARSCWALFGSPGLSTQGQPLPRVCKIVSAGLALIALGLSVWSYIASGQRPGHHPGQSREEQVWHLRREDRILARVSHTPLQPIKGVVRIELPYSQAKIVEARSETRRLAWKSLGDARYELFPEEIRGRTAAHARKKLAETVFENVQVEYEFPLSALERQTNYRVKLYALRPVQTLHWRLLLDEGCDYEFSDPSGQAFFHWAYPEGRQMFGTCGFEVRARRDAAPSALPSGLEKRAP